jgi:NAD(P)-dependent dehydrogenase (short-subunit alcohol dehydrogenase family)
LSSKTALNSLTRLVFNDVQDTNIRCNAVCPGWVRTDMGGPDADRTTKKGAESILWLALMGHDSPNGGFLKDKKEIPW